MGIRVIFSLEIVGSNFMQKVTTLLPHPKKEKNDLKNACIKDPQALKNVKNN